MKKLKFLLFSTVVLLLALLPFISTTASPVVKNINELLITIDTSQITEDSVSITQVITSYAKDMLGEDGGKLEITIDFTATEEANVTLSKKEILPGANISAEDLEGEIKVKLTFTIGDKDALTSLKITSAKLTAYPNTPEPSPSGSPSGSPTGSLEPSPTGSLDPSGSPTGSLEPSPTVTDVITEPTQEPTKRPTVTPEPTKDNYSSNSQTQAPPTLSLPPDVTIDPNIPTPVPEEVTPPPLQKVSNSPSLSFIALFAFLVLLLAVDLFLIYWRKQMGCGTLINNGISRRKVRDDLVDYPENTQSSDLEDAIAENEQKE